MAHIPVSPLPLLPTLALGETLKRHRETKKGAKTMNKRDAKQQFIETVGTTWIYECLDNDKPALRTAWNDFVDALQKNRQITEAQASSWANPWKGSR